MDLKNLRNMSRKQRSALNKLFVLLVISIIAAITLFFVDRHRQNDGNAYDVDSTYTSDISWSYDFVKEPKFDSSVFVRTIIVPIEKGSNCIGKDYFDDSTKIAKSVGDSAVSLPIVQKVYSDSTYTAYVSGYEPNLDSILIKQRIITNTLVKTVTIKSTKRWNVGVVGGYGYGILSNRLEPFVGIGFSYNIFGK